MDWFSATYLAFCALGALFAGYSAWQSRRDAANWVIDPDSKGLIFQNWTEFGFSMLICCACSGVIVATLLI